MQWMPRLRTLLARRPWIWWLGVALIAAALAASVAASVGRLDAARRTWGETASVVVAARDIAAGEPLVGESVELPLALIPATSMTVVPPGSVAVQRLARGEVVVEADITRSSGPAAFLPDGWVAIAVEVPTTSYFGVGDPAVVLGDGATLAPRAIIAGVDDGRVVVGVPAEVAPAVAAALVEHTAVVALS